MTIQNALTITPPVTPNSQPMSKYSRPQTSAYALCDSPSGLLAYVLDAIRPILPKSPSRSPPNSRRASVASRRQSVQSVGSSRSPMSPQGYAQSYGTPGNMSGFSTAGSSPVALRSPVLERPPTRLSPQSSMGSQGFDSSGGGTVSWTPDAIVDWTMIYWLPGPEASLRWVTNSDAIMPSFWAGFSMVPLAITHFHGPSVGGAGAGQTPPQWSEAYHRIAMIRRREGRVRFPAWEAPIEVVSDIREFVGLLGLSAAGSVPNIGMQ